MLKSIGKVRKIQDLFYFCFLLRCFSLPLIWYSRSHIALTKSVAVVIVNDVGWFGANSHVLHITELQVLIDDVMSTQLVLCTVLVLCPWWTIKVFVKQVSLPYHLILLYVCVPCECVCAVVGLSKIYLPSWKYGKSNHCMSIKQAKLIVNNSAVVWCLYKWWRFYNIWTFTFSYHFW